jgi:NADPH:quinone reductase-like Zn-dependent oxidoreductase
MKAAVVRERGKGPVYGEWDAPSPRDGHEIVTVSASALTELVKGRASGAHYSAPQTLPTGVGVDGVGRLSDGRRVYFILPVSPFGSMAEQTLVPATNVVPIPDGVSDVQAAALGNPGMASWTPLTTRARLARGERVLINGATGIAGRLAVRVAKFLGASHVAATGRDPETLLALADEGADVIISLAQTPEELDLAFNYEFSAGIDVVLDYLWGPSAEAIISSTVKHVKEGGRLRFVQVGASSAPSIPLAAASLRSSGLELIGSGLGSVPLPVLLEGVRGVLDAAGVAQWTVDAWPIPLSELETAWTRPPGKRRIIFTVGT